MELVEERYIEEAAEGMDAATREPGVLHPVTGRSRVSGWKKWTALAACFCLIVAGGGKLWWDSLSRDLPLDGEIKLPDGSEEYHGDGIWIPYMELPETDEGIMADMIACVVYKGGIYAHFTDGYYDEDAETVRGLLGEKLGTAKGNLDEWSTQDAYTEEFAGSICGDVYAVKGYDTSFRIAVAGDDYVLFLERLNGIVVDTGADIFEERLHLAENWKSVAYLDHETWNHGERPVEPEPVELQGDVWDAFLTEINAGKLENLWHKNPAEMEEASGRNIYDRIVLHLYVTMQDGTVNQLRISEDGYVLYEGLLWYGVKISEETLAAILHLPWNPE